MRACCDRWELVLLLVLLSLVVLTSAQQGECSKWEGFPKWCAPILAGTTVFSPPNSTQSSIAQLIAPTALLTTFVPSNRMCIEAVFNFVCRSAFWSCDNDPMIPTPPCRELCERISQVCPLNVTLALQLDCNATGPFGPLFPPYDPANPQLCNNTVNEVTEDEACAGPAVVYDNEKEACGVRCPLADFTDTEVNVVRYYDGTIMVIALFGGTFTFASYSLIKEYRQKPVRWLAFSLLFAMGALIAMMLAPDWHENVCAGETDFDISHHARSVVIAAFYGVGALGAALWWMCIALNLVLRLYMKVTDRMQQRLYWAYHVFCWGITAMCTITLLAKHNTSSYSVIVYLAGRDVTLNNIFNTAPLFTAAAASLFLSFLVFIKVFQAIHKGGENVKKLMRGQLRLFLFVLFFLPLDILIVSVQIWQQLGDPSPVDTWTADYEEWVTCLTLGLEPKCTLKSHFPYSIYMAIIVSNSLQSLSPTLFFAFSYDIYCWWRCFLQDLVHGKLNLDLTLSTSRSRVKSSSLYTNTDSIAASRRTVDASHS